MGWRERADEHRIIWRTGYYTIAFGVMLIVFALVPLVTAADPLASPRWLTVGGVLSIALGVSLCRSWAATPVAPE